MVPSVTYIPLQKHYPHFRFHKKKFVLRLRYEITVASVVKVLTNVIAGYKKFLFNNVHNLLRLNENEQTVHLAQRIWHKKKVTRIKFNLALNDLNIIQIISSLLLHWPMISNLPIVQALVIHSDVH